jgi:adenylate kinase
MAVIVLLGAPGAGKGTQAPVIAEHLGVPILGSGDLLRTAVAAGTALGRAADDYMSRGQLVPDATIVRVFLDRLEQPDATAGAVLDGFPRTRVQAEALDVELVGAGRRVDRAVLVDVPTEELISRMANRRICTANGHVYNLASNPPEQAGICDLDGSELVQREDDKEETVRKRLEVYEKQTRPLVDYYSKWAAQGDTHAPRYRKISGKGSVDDIGARALAALK